LLCREISSYSGFNFAGILITFSYELNFRSSDSKRLHLVQT